MAKDTPSQWICLLVSIALEQELETQLYLSITMAKDTPSQWIFILVSITLEHELETKPKTDKCQLLQDHYFAIKKYFKKLYFTKKHTKSFILLKTTQNTTALFG